MLRFKNITEKEDEGLVYESNISKLIFYVEIKEEDKEAKEKEIAALEVSIKRREGLLANEGYVNKAPAQIVENERLKLAEEKEKLAKLRG